MKENLTHYRTCVCNVNYHMVWSVKYLKGISGRKLFERFPEIRNQLWKGELWNHSYYVETVGSVSEEDIRRYIEHQSKSLLIRWRRGNAAVKETSIKVSREYANLIGHMCYAASKLWNVCNYERQH